MNPFVLHQNIIKLTSMTMILRTLNVSRDKQGNLNFLTGRVSASEGGDSQDGYALLNQLLLQDVHLSIEQFHYLDDLESLAISATNLDVSSVFLPVIDNHQWLVENPGILQKHSFEGKVSAEQLLVNNYQLSDIAIFFTERKEHFVFEDVTA